MKLTALFAAACLCAFAADPVSTADQERLSRAMLKLQGAQLDAQPYIIPMNTAQKEVSAIIDEYRAKYKAVGCQIDPISKEWQCPKAEVKPEPKK